MSIVTTAQAVPSRLYSLYSSLVDNPDGEVRERLEGWATPSSLRTRGGTDEDGETATTLFTNTLAEAKRLGLVEEIGDRLRIPTEAREGFSRKTEHEERFRAYLTRTLFDPSRAAETQQAGFMLALAWFLTLNPMVPIGFATAPQNLLRSGLGEQYLRTELTSLNRYQNFLYWARYLGFATLFGARDQDEGKDARRVFPDPYIAIASALPTIFSFNRELSGEAFMGRLAGIFPVFEGGSVRQEIEQMSGSSPYSSDRRLSPATSLALQRLADRQRIEMITRADAPPLLLDLGGRMERVTHIAGRSEA
jgi:hypothetical protein